jgi:curved DNA-binding protein CbpA
MTRQCRNYYEVLGVARNATAAEIHRAYRRLARQYHPDVNSDMGARARFDEVSSAYEVLHDPRRRASYDRSIIKVSPGAEVWRDGDPLFARRRPPREVPRFINEDVDQLAMRFFGPTGQRPIVTWSVHRRTTLGLPLLPQERVILRWWLC